MKQLQDKEREILKLKEHNKLKFNLITVQEATINELRKKLAEKETVAVTDNFENITIKKDISEMKKMLKNLTISSASFQEHFYRLNSTNEMIDMVEPNMLEFHLLNETDGIHVDAEIDLREKPKDVATSVIPHRPIPNTNLSLNENNEILVILRRYRLSDKSEQVLMAIRETKERHLLGQALLTVLFSREELKLTSYEVKKNYKPLESNRLRLIEEVCFHVYNAESKEREALWKSIMGKIKSKIRVVRKTEKERELKEQRKPL